MIRFTALSNLHSRDNQQPNQLQREKYSDLFGKYVFTNDKLEKYVGKEPFKHIKEAIADGEKISAQVADQVAAAMRNWAMEHGATHYTHWFQPLTGLTAEKHDAFLETTGGAALEKFSGGALIQQEPDASSFPNGGIRQTFEARGYTAWDPSSPAFLMKSGGSLTLCIPTIFISYTGEALDYKAPLLKTLFQLENAALDLCHYFDADVKSVMATLGIEQEYFLVDAGLFNARPDLVVSNRTLLGHSPARGQQLDDHYFGSIPERIQAFMVDFERECIQLGIPLKTRHNEVAPSQYECAPTFEHVNLAVDHNQLLMDVIDKVARRHRLRAILHEKPFANVNGSGKHCNFSMSTNTGVNLLSPGKTPTSNLQFLTFFINVIKAVHSHADILRASIASSGNDHRLGANEAPPAIISVFIGRQLSKVLESLKTNALEGHKDDDGGFITINAPQIPDVSKDNTDRNRTSPFAFTGNKFEFRAVGSSNNTSSPMTVLSAAVAEQLRAFKKAVDEKMSSGMAKDQAILAELQSILLSSESILFEGNNYGDEWLEEAARRGLSNITNTPEALKAYTSDSTKALFNQLGVMSDRELEARHEILLENYALKIQIESRLIGELAMTHVIPAATRYLNELIDSLAKLKSVGIAADVSSLEETVQQITSHISAINKGVREMIEARKKANKLEDIEHLSIAYCKEVKPFFDTIRYHADKLELMVDDSSWQLPKYRELLFLR